MKDTVETYKLREAIHPRFDYLFDRISGLFVRSRWHVIKNPKKILFLRNDHIGDMVYSTQVFREIKKKFPKVKIYVIATGGNRQIIDKDPYVDEIIEIDLFWRRGFRGFLYYLKVLKKIRKEKFDIGIDLRRSKLNIFFFLWIPKIRSRISFYNVNGGKAFLTHPILYNERMNYIYENVKMVNEAFGINITNCMPHIINDKEDEAKVKMMMKEKRLKKYVVFAPGATTSSKKWPSKKFEELIKLFHKKYPSYQIVLSGANSDRERIEKLCEGRDFCVPLINFDLKLMAIVFKKAGVVVANDGAGTDISWSAGGRLISLVGPIDIVLHKPLKKSKVLHHKVPCYPCGWTKPCKKPCGLWCMDLITVDEVMKAIEGFMN